MLSQAAAFDQLLEAVALEHRDALEVHEDPAMQQAKRIERLLAGESIGPDEIRYDLNVHHVGMIVTGEVKVETIHSLAQVFDRRLLIVSPGEGTLWAWLGGRKPLDAQRVRRVASARTWPDGVSVAIGEPSYGLSGWRLTHQQARAAMSIAERSSRPVTRYADVAVVSALLQDDLLVNSLNQLYLAPLEEERGRGEALLETLHAYFSCQRNVSSAAAALGVKRHTVTNRLRAVEHILGQQLSTCATTLDLTLSLERLTNPPEEAAPRGN